MRWLTCCLLTGIIVLPLVGGITLASAPQNGVPVASSNLGSGREVLAYPDPSGEIRTYSTAGFIDIQNPFFQVLGSNSRACITCHQPSDGWSITPAHIQARFDSTDGLDPIFRLND